VRRTPDSGCTSWPTPAARDWKSSASNMHGENSRPLNEVARLSHWPTPDAHARGTVQPPEGMTRESGAKVQLTLHGAAALSLRAQLADPGPMPIGSSAETQTADRPSPGQLNPEHSRWLQGYPAAWGFCGATATRSSRK
jgi:hypothetical protein